MQVQLLYMDDCDHREQAWSAPWQAMLDTEVSDYIEVIRIQGEEQARRRNFASLPTILIDGRDIAPGGFPVLGCREFHSRSGQVQGWPDLETLRWAVGCCA